MSDASAGFAIDKTTFMAMDDERNVFQVYSAEQSGVPLQSLDWNANLGIAADDAHPEADIEGTAVLGKTVYGISSHGRNKDGKWRANRYRFFGMTVEKKSDQVTARPVGKPYARLALDMIASPQLKGLGLAEAIAPERKKDKSLAPKEAGLNIEGLAASADGKSLLIGLRNPRPDGAALVIPLMNPEAVLSQGVAATFGEPIHLRLTGMFRGEVVGLGIRSMEYSPRHQAYLIIAGAQDAREVFAMYRWSGKSADAAQLLPKATAAIARVKSFSPEAIIIYPARDKVQLLSDDGSLLVPAASADDCEEGAFRDGMCEAKSLLEPAKKTFRSLWVSVE